MDAINATITFLLFVSLLSSPSTSAQPEPPRPEQLVPPGTTLSPSSVDSTSWLSRSGLFAFGFHPQGNGFVVGIWLQSMTPVWTANRDDPPVTSNAKLQFTKSGRLILVTEQGQNKLIANATASFASMLDSGNFVLYDKNFRIIWQSFNNPTDTLLGDQSLRTGGQLSSSLSETNSSSGRFHLEMQGDGNLVLYPAYTADAVRDAYWDTDTAKDGMKLSYHLYLNKTGLLQIRNNSNSQVIFNLPEDDDDTRRNHAIYRATLDFDGVFRLYAHLVHNGSHKIIRGWPESSCQIKGFCGFNSYCTFNDLQAVCNCLEGYKFINTNEKTLGCERNYSKAECSRSGGAAATFYNMVPMPNIVWEGHPYSQAKMPSEEKCSFACLVDCNCWAALIYGDGRCKKHGLPLTYVRRTHVAESTSVAAESTTAFLKVGGNLKGNEYDKPFPPQPQPLPIKNTSSKAMVHIIVVTSVFTVLLCSAIAISCHYIYKVRVLRYKRLTETTGNLGLNEEMTLRRFSYNELKRATNHFREELGKGSFGAVYKGALNKGRRLIAVKRLEKLVEEGEREFQAEVRAIGRTHHRNLVRLLGFCAEGSKRLLVYEYMSNGSLGKLLFGDQRRRPDWDERVRIALDIARGILYLHEECQAPIIHCDLKPQNILMDEFLTAKIADFGLAKLLMPDQTRTFTMVRGTRGYMAPEWNKLNVPISVKTDVYSYGIVLLEVLCCRRNLQVNVSEPEETLLSGWAYKCFVAGDINKLVPWEVIDKNVLENMVKVALWCFQDDPVLRPTMKSVVLMLEGITDIAIPPCPNSSST